MLKGGILLMEILYSVETKKIVKEVMVYWL